jgi:hypothetical protein
VKHLKIEYKTEAGQSIVLFDGEVNEVVWSDGPNGIKVEGKTGTGGGGMGSLIDLLTGNSKARTEAIVEEKKAGLIKASEPSPDGVIETDPIEIIRAGQA